MSVDVIVEGGDWDAGSLAGWARDAETATLCRLGLDPEAFEIALLACDDRRIAELNAGFRGKPAATNVLSWPSAERGADRDGADPRPPAPDADSELGDIALAHGVCAAEAAAAGMPFGAHVTHLIVHGILHLLGYDHERPGDAGLMEGLETEILVSLGHQDPYRGGGPD